jgi:HAD superfamily hydrolase (TIGR01548 family)
MEVILDIDGVLVNTDDSYSRAAIETARELGARERSLEEVFRYRSEGAYNDDYDIAEAFLRDEGISLPRRRLIEVFQNYYLGEKWREGLWTGFIEKEKLLAGPEFCAWLRKRGRFSFFTGRPKDEAFYLVKRLGLFQDMDHLVGMYDVARKKPDPEGLLQIISLHGYRRPLSCGDTLDDLEAARAAGIDFVGVLPPSESARRLMRAAFEKARCDRVLGSINELPAYLEAKEKEQEKDIS